MKYNWQTEKLGEVCKIINGSTPIRSRKDFWEMGTIPWFTIDDIRNQGRIIKNTNQKIAEKALSKSRLLPENTVLICCTASVGEYAITKIQLTTNQQFNGLVIKDEKKIDPLFLFYFSSMLKERLLKLSGKTTIDFIPVSRLREIEISFPSLEAQKQIIRFLDEVFEKIEKAKENTEKNLQNSNELFESYLQSIFSNSSNDWKQKKLGDLTNLNRGHNPPKSKFIHSPKDGYVRFYQIRDGWSDNYAVYVPDSPQLHKVNAEDILMVAYRHIGRVFRGVNGAFNVALCKITNSAKDMLDDEYLFQILQAQYVKGELLKRSERSLIPSMSIEHLRHLQIPLPPIVEQKDIVEKLDRLSEQTKKLEEIYRRKLADLEELKKSVLQKAFAGEL